MSRITVSTFAQGAGAIEHIRGNKPDGTAGEAFVVLRTQDSAEDVDQRVQRLPSTLREREDATEVPKLHISTRHPLKNDVGEPKARTYSI